MKKRNAQRGGMGAALVALVLGTFACKPEPKSSPAPRAASPSASASSGAQAAASPGQAASPGPQRPAGFVVYASFYPLAYFAERIGGSHVTVKCPVPPGADPAFWMPSPDEVREFQKADVVLVNGASFEKWLDKVSLPESNLVNTTEALAGEYIVLASAVKHSHGPAGEHSHEGVDGHTWVDPRAARVQAEAVLEALLSRYPAPSEEFHANFEKLAADLDALAARAEALSPQLADQVLLASHPAYNYLAREFHWNVQSFTLDPAGEPSAEDWDLLRNSVDTMPALILLWEQEPRKDVADKLLEEFGLLSVVFSPVETLDPQQAAAGMDYIKLMHQNFDRLEEVLGTGQPADSAAE